MSKTKSSSKRKAKGIDVYNNELSKKKSIIRELIPNRIRLKPKNESQSNLIKLIEEKEITFVSGPAGTGKTYLALAKALQLLQDDNNEYEHIYLLKSVTTLKGEEIGFIKGDVEDKMFLTLQSFMMNVEKIIDKSVINKLHEHDITRILPLAYIRGASIDNSIIIVDELQNISIDNLRTILTRIGENSKIIALGDTKQIDIKNKSVSSLNIAFQLFNDIDEIGLYQFNIDDIVRNPLIKKIEDKFEKFEINNNYNNKQIL